MLFFFFLFLLAHKNGAQKCRKHKNFKLTSRSKHAKTLGNKYA